MRLTLRLCLLVAWLACGSILQAAEPAASLWKGDFRAAQAEARELGQPVLLHFYGPRCGPCRMMEHEVFTTAEFRKLVEGGLIAVKVDASTNAELTQKFGIASVPSDLVISPEGKVLFRASGFKSGQGRSYMDSIARFRPAPKPRTLPKSDPEELVARREPAVKSKVPATATSSAGTDRVVPAPRTLVTPDDDVSNDAGSTSDDSVADEPRRPSVAAKSIRGLDGFCPVTLRQTGKWEHGSTEYTVEYQGVTYRMRDAATRDEFRDHPEKYAPQMGGLDLVSLDDHKTNALGSTKFGAYYNGDLYLFRNRESRTRFKQNPARYARVREGGNLQLLDRLASATMP